MAGLLAAVAVVWDRLAEPRAARCALMARRVGKGGSGKAALAAFLARLIEEALDDALWPDLPRPADFPGLDSHHAAVTAQLAATAAAQAAILARYEAILDGREPDAPAPPPGVVIVGPWR